MKFGRRLGQLLGSKRRSTGLVCLSMVEAAREDKGTSDADVTCFIPCLVLLEGFPSRSKRARGSSEGEFRFWTLPCKSVESQCYSREKSGGIIVSRSMHLVPSPAMPLKTRFSMATHRCPTLHCGLGGPDVLWAQTGREKDRAFRTEPRSTSVPAAPARLHACLHGNRYLIPLACRETFECVALGSFRHGRFSSR